MLGVYVFVILMGFAATVLAFVIARAELIHGLEPTNSERFKIGAISVGTGLVMIGLLLFVTWFDSRWGWFG